MTMSTCITAVHFPSSWSVPFSPCFTSAPSFNPLSLRIPLMHTLLRQHIHGKTETHINTHTRARSHIRERLGTRKKTRKKKNCTTRSTFFVSTSKPAPFLQKTYIHTSTQRELKSFSAPLSYSFLLTGLCGDTRKKLPTLRFR